MDRGQVTAQLCHLRGLHDQLSPLHLVGEDEDFVAAVRQQQDFLRHRELVGIGDQVLANLRVDVVDVVSVAKRVIADGYPVGQLV